MRSPPGRPCRRARSRRRRAMFDPVADPPVAFDPVAAEAALKKAGWTKAADGWRLPNVKAPLAIELVSPDAGVEPGRLRGRRGRRPRLASLGLSVTHVAAPAGRLRHRPTGDRQVPGGGRRRDRSDSTRTSTRCSPRARPSPADRTSSGSRIRRSTSCSSRPAVRARTRTGRPPIRRSRRPSRRVATCSRWPSPTSRSWSATRSRDRPSARSPTRLTDSGMC